MHSHALKDWIILLELHTLRMSALVLIGGVVATLAIAAGEGDESTHE